MGINLKKDRKRIIFPSILIIMLSISMIILGVQINNQAEIYTTTAVNYQMDIPVNNQNKKTKLSGVQLLEKDKKLEFTFNTKSIDENSDYMSSGLLYIKILDGDDKELLVQKLENGVQKINIPLTDELLQKSEVQDNNKYAVDIKIEYYSIDEERELEFAKPFTETTIKLSDAYVYNDLSDYFENNKTEIEKKNELLYIQKYYLNQQDIKYLLQANNINVHRILSQNIEEQHKELGDVYKNYQKKMKIYLDLLHEKGVSKEDINYILNSTSDIQTKVNNLEQLDVQADRNLEEILSGYKKELNTNYKYNAEQINKLVEGKSSLEQKKILEEEVSKLKTESKLDDQIEVKIKELKKEKVSTKSIEKITKNQELSKEDRLKQLTALLEKEKKKDKKN